MKNLLLAACGALAVTLSVLPAHAEATETADVGIMPKTLDVVLLNEGGKYVAVDFKHIDKGEKCRMDQDAVIARVGDGATKGTSRVRAMMPQLKSGGCPFMTEFEIDSEQYTAATKLFADKQEAAEKKLQDMTKEAGKKIGEALGGIFGSKPTPPKTLSL